MGGNLKMAVITLAEYKILAQITGTTQDTLIQTLIPLVEGDIKAICSRTFEDENGADDFPEGIELYAARMISEQIAMLKQGYSSGFSSESQGGYSYTKDADPVYGYSKGIMSGLRKWRYVSAKEGATLSQWRDRRYMSLKNLAEGFAIYTEPNTEITVSTIRVLE
jgi:hypothetical protein